MDSEAGRIRGIASSSEISRLGECAGINPVAARSRAIVPQPRKSRQLLAALDLLLANRVLQVGECLAVDLLQHFGERRVEWIAVIPGQVEDRIGKLPALLLIQLADLQENLRQNRLIQARIAWTWDRHVLPLQPTGRVGEGPILLRKPGTRQSINRGLNLLHLLGRDPGRSPEFARFVGIDFADDHKIRLLERIDVLFRVWADLDAIHPEGEEALDNSLVHVVPEEGPRVVSIDFRQIVEGPVVLHVGRRAIERLEQADGELRRVPIVIQ